MPDLHLGSRMPSVDLGTILPALERPHTVYTDIAALALGQDKV